MFGDKALEQFVAIMVIQVNDFDSILAQPRDAALECPALAHYNRPDPELSY